MKKLLKGLVNIKTLASISMMLAMGVALWVGNLSAFLGWMCAFFYSLKEECC